MSQTISRQIKAMPRERLLRIDALIHERLNGKEQPVEIPAKEGREVVEVKRVGTVTYQLERVRCGCKTCHCAKGRGHGPYWYGYWSVNGKTRSKYVGKTLPEEARPERARQLARRARRSSARRR